jgi:hypothetical protein
MRLGEDFWYPAPFAPLPPQVLEMTRLPKPDAA